MVVEDCWAALVFEGAAGAAENEKAGAGLLVDGDGAGAANVEPKENVLGAAGGGTPAAEELWAAGAGAPNWNDGAAAAAVADGAKGIDLTASFELAGTGAGDVDVVSAGALDPNVNGAGWVVGAAAAAEAVVVEAADSIAAGWVGAPKLNDDVGAFGSA